MRPYKYDRTRQTVTPAPGTWNHESPEPENAGVGTIKPVQVPERRYRRGRQVSGIMGSGTSSMPTRGIDGSQPGEEIDRIQPGLEASKDTFQRELNLSGAPVVVTDLAIRIAMIQDHRNGGNKIKGVS